MKTHIVGVWWRACADPICHPHNSSFFRGEIELEGSRFNGHVQDYLGDASISGTLDLAAGTLKFEKEYCFDALARGGAKFPIKYVLENPDGQGWRGTFTTAEWDEDHTLSTPTTVPSYDTMPSGGAICVLMPAFAFITGV